MDIIVCIKQVPDTLEVQINKETNTLVREGVDSVINPFDFHALEEALRLKEQYGGKITVLSMGPGQAEAALREAISLGADNAVLLSDRAFAGSDTLATSYALSKGVQKIGRFDLIICGRQAVDGDTAHIGPQLAERLRIPHVSCVLKIHDMTEGSIVTDRIAEQDLEQIRLPLPCLITVTKSINEPRFPSLRGKTTAVKSEITVWAGRDISADPSRIGLDGSPTRVVRMSAPRRYREVRMLEGTAQEQVRELLSNLREAEVV